jgi:hypothetical protein
LILLVLLVVLLVLLCPELIFFRSKVAKIVFCSPIQKLS